MFQKNLQKVINIVSYVIMDIYQRFIFKMPEDKCCVCEKINIMNFIFTFKTHMKKYIKKYIKNL